MKISDEHHTPFLLKPAIAVLLLVLGAATAVNLSLYLRQVRSITGDGSSAPLYDRHYALVGDPRSPFLSSVYEAAHAYGLTHGSYVELTGAGLEASYSSVTLMDIARESKVGGIIVDADDSEEMRDAVNAAASSGIPVVCIGTDSYGADRRSYVGISYYALGQEYGKKIAALKKDTVQMVMIMMSPGKRTSSQNMVYSGIIDYIREAGLSSRFSFESYQVGDGSSFSTAEAVTDILGSYSLPSILVCLDETITSAVCQGIVDANRVSEVTVFGFNLNDMIRNAIRKGVISESVTVPAEAVAENAVECLDTAVSGGFVTEYVSIGFLPVTKDNLDQYENDGSPAEQDREAEAQ